MSAKPMIRYLRVYGVVRVGFPAHLRIESAFPPLRLRDPGRRMITSDVVAYDHASGRIETICTIYLPRRPQNISVPAHLAFVDRLPRPRGVL